MQTFATVLLVLLLVAVLGGCKRHHITKNHIEVGGPTIITPDSPCDCPTTAQPLTPPFFFEGAVWIGDAGAVLPPETFDDENVTGDLILRAANGNVYTLFERYEPATVHLPGERYELPLPSGFLAITRVDYLDTLPETGMVLAPDDGKAIEVVSHKRLIKVGKAKIR